MRLLGTIALAALFVAPPAHAAGMVCPAGQTPPFASDADARTFFVGFVDAIFGTQDDAKRERYFAPDYRAILNGKAMDRAAEKAHFAQVRASSRKLDYSYGRIIATCDGLAEQHSVNIEQKDGTKIALRAMSMVVIDQGRIKTIDEVAGTADQ
jgi:Leu/Phe-tRNA-protein transferase